MGAKGTAGLFGRASTGLVAAVVALSAALTLGGCGSRQAADDQTFESDVQAGRAGAEVTFDATLAVDPVSDGTHERFTVTAASGETVEVDHNVSLASAVPAKKGDQVVIHGQLYIDPGPRVGVHCTHVHTSRGCPLAGWIELNGNYYE